MPDRALLAFEPVPGLLVTPHIEVFAEYAARVVEVEAGSSRWTHDFALSRVHLGLLVAWEGVAAGVLLEGVWSTSEGALIGVAGDSVVARVREAWAGYDVPGWLEVRAGIVPTLTVPALEAAWGLRAVAPSLAQQAGLLVPADLGVTARLLLPFGHGFVGAAARSGEGYTSRDLNRGKTVEVAAGVHPLASVPGAEPLGVLVAFEAGSTGTGSARADRLTTALAWSSAAVGAGVAFTWGWGLADDGGRETAALEAFARVEPWLGLILGARATHWWRDVSTSGDTLTTVAGVVGWRVATPLEVFFALERSLPDDRAKDALPGADRWDIRTIARVDF